MNRASESCADADQTRPSDEARIKANRTWTIAYTCPGHKVKDKPMGGEEEEKTRTKSH